MKRLLSILLCAAMCLTGCARPAQVNETDDEAYALYFLARDLRAVPGDGALQPEFAHLNHAESMETQEMAEILMQELLKGPLSDSLKSPIPLGTTLESLEIHGSQAVVNLSAAYGGLSGVGLTLADYAVTLTLTQLPEIMSVKIMVRGKELAYRDRQVFSAREVLLVPQGDVVRTVEAVLWFLNESGSLRREEQILELYEGDTQVAAVARALENGPESKELYPVLPEGFRLKSVWQEEETCYVNLSSALLGSFTEEVDLSVALLALSRSLCSLESVGEVRFMVDGEFAQSYGPVNIEKPYTE